MLELRSNQRTASRLELPNQFRRTALTHQAATRNVARWAVVSNRNGISSPRGQPFSSSISGTRVRRNATMASSVGASPTNPGNYYPRHTRHPPRRLIRPGFRNTFHAPLLPPYRRRNAPWSRTIVSGVFVIAPHRCETRFAGPGGSLREALFVLTGPQKIQKIRQLRNPPRRWLLNLLVFDFSHRQCSWQN